jgi:hypothetical protein
MSERPDVPVKGQRKIGILGKIKGRGASKGKQKLLDSRYPCVRTVLSTTTPVFLGGGRHCSYGLGLNQYAQLSGNDAAKEFRLHVGHLYAEVNEAF